MTASSHTHLKAPKALACLLASLIFTSIALPMQSQAADNTLPPYEQSLRRLATIVGALMHLDPLCNQGDADQWYGQMAALLKAENPDDVRNRQLTFRFNDSYQSMKSTYKSCNSQARKVTDLYLQEGQNLLVHLKLKHSR